MLGPLDMAKQFGHCKGLMDALMQMIRTKGVVFLLQSFPITLAANIPRGMIMVGMFVCEQTFLTEDLFHKKSRKCSP